MSASSIAQAVWEYETRTLNVGSNPPVTTRLLQIAATVWAYGTRTLSGTNEITPDPGTATLAGVAPSLDLGIRPPGTIRGS